MMGQEEGDRKGGGQLDERRISERRERLRQQERDQIAGEGENPTGGDGIGEDITA